MDNNEATQCTQSVVDPRRMGRNNSGLSVADISDVMCILHPCSPAAFEVVASTAEKAPHNVLQNDGFQDYDDGLTLSVLEEQETFILPTDGPSQPMDLALRFSAHTINPTLGFVFGRHASLCDIVLATDEYKRVSNMHFSIFVNDSGVLMLQDMSTNGTLVDEVLLSRKFIKGPSTRMLNSGSIVQILSPKPEHVLKFIVRIPLRDGHFEAYEAKFQDHMRRLAIAQDRAQRDMVAQHLAVAQPKAPSTNSIKAPMMHSQFGMQWNGGDMYNVVNRIGKGAFATVYQLATKREGQIFAAKELEKRKFMKNGILDRKLDNEMQIMKAISHPNIVQYVDYQDHANHLYIIMEFVPCGDLQLYLSRKGALPENLGKKMAMQVLDSLAYLHAKKITHRDIKPDNILIANLDPEHFTVKLSDFGLSKVVKDNDTFLKTFCGTLLYCAPEVFPHYDAHVARRGQKRPRKGAVLQPSKFHSYSQSVDIWSFGAVLWYSLCIKPPFEGVADPTGRGMFEKIMMTPLDPADLVKQGVSDDAVALLADMLNTDPASRPTPAFCLRHKWFGLHQTDATEGATDSGLLPITEEDEGNNRSEEPDVSRLSLDEQGSSDDSQPFDEVSIHTDSMNFFDARQSKRLKSDAGLYRENEEIIDSSPDMLLQSIPIVLDTRVADEIQSRPFQRRLFGEISRSMPNVVGGFVTPDVTQGLGLDGSTEQAELHGTGGSPSLQGVGSLLRDVHMDSPRGTDSPGAEPNEPTTPHTPIEEQGAQQADGTPSGQNDITPKQPQRPFDRQIRLKVGPGFFFVPEDKSTHNLQYASKMSGLDFGSHSSVLIGDDVSLPATTENSTTTEVDTDTEHEPIPASQTSPSQFLKPPPRLGRLVSSSDSFAPITINLSQRFTSWGRLSSNNCVYPNEKETRIPKRGLFVYFKSENTTDLDDETDLTKLADLRCFAQTESRAGIFVNGVRLPPNEAGKKIFGRLYTGDEIVICVKGQNGEPGLKFICEFFHGDARQRRPPGGPRFVVEAESGGAAPKVRAKGKEKEKENVALGGEGVVA